MDTEDLGCVCVYIYTHTHTMNYYSAIKNILLSREGQILYDSTYMWNLKYYTNEPIYKIKIDFKTNIENRLCGWQ